MISVISQLQMRIIKVENAGTLWTDVTDRLDDQIHDTGTVLLQLSCGILLSSVLSLTKMCFGLLQTFCFPPKVVQHSNEHRCLSKMSI